MKSLNRKSLNLMMVNRENFYVVPETISDNDLREAAYCLMKDASKFLGDLLERIDCGTDIFADVCRAIIRMAEAMAQNGAICAGAKVAQKKEASSSSPLSSPLKEGEESSKEEEEIHPPILPPSSPEENLCVGNAREEAQNLAQAEEVERQFKLFWQTYDYKRGKEKAWAAWKRLSQRDREAAMAGIEAYKADCELFQRPMLYPQGYINQRRWEDDFNSGLENAERKNGRSRIYTREDIRNMEQQQRLEGIARVAAEFRAGLV